eukprot:435176_1
MDELALGLGVLAIWRLWEQFQTEYCLREAHTHIVICKYRDEALRAVFLFGFLIVITLVVVKAEKWVRGVSYNVCSCISPSHLAKTPCHDSKSQAGIEKELVDSRNVNMEEATGQKSVMHAESMAASNTRTDVISAALEESSMTSNMEEQLSCRGCKPKRSHSASSVEVLQQQQGLSMKSAEGTGLQQLFNNLQVRSSRSNILRGKRNEITYELPAHSKSSSSIDVNNAHPSISPVRSHQGYSTHKPPTVSSTSVSPIDIPPLISPACEEQEAQHTNVVRGFHRPRSLTDVRHEEPSHSQKLYTGDVVKDGTDNHAKVTCSEIERPSHHRHKGSGGKHLLASVFTGPWYVMNRAAKGIWHHSGKHHHRKRREKPCCDPLEKLKIGLDKNTERPLINHGESFEKTGGGKISTIGSDQTSEQSLDGFALGVMTVPICLASFILLMVQTHQPSYLPNGAPDDSPLPYVMILFECSLISSLHQVIAAVMLPLGLGFFSLWALIIALAIGIAQQPLLCAWTMAIHQVFLTIMDQVQHFRKAELCMITQAFALWTVDALLCTAFATLSSTASDKWSKVFPIPPKRSNHFFIVQSGLIGLIASRTMLASVELIWMQWNAWQKRRAATFTRQVQSSNPPATALPPIAVCIVLLTGMTVTVCWWMEVLIEEESPILWIGRQVFDSTYSYVRIGLCLYWVLVMALCLPFIPWVVERFKLRRIVARKLFHFIALAMFLPAVIFDSEFLSIAIGVALGFIILLEFLPGVMVTMVQSYYSLFLDHNDSHELAVTHIALLFGCALPLWLTEGAGATTCSPFPLNGPFLSASGILVLGIGDSASALIGSTYGRWSWAWAINNRTIEGSVAMFISLLMAFILLSEFTTSNAAVNCPGLGSTCPLGLSTLLLPVGIVVILEALTTELDNIILPPYAFSSLVLLLLSRQPGGAAEHLHTLQSID